MDVLFSCKTVKSMEKESGSVMAAIGWYEETENFF